MGGPGIGKTTLANEICVKWAKRDGVLANDFDAVILIQLRSVQQRSIEEVMAELIGKEAYQQLENTGGTRCLIILEGLDEMGAERQKKDPFLRRVINNCSLFEDATILITSRPHACKNLRSGRTVEVLGFGMEQIKEFVQKAFHNDSTSADILLRQLDDYPHIRSFCYIPLNLVMVVDIFQFHKQLPSTVTELYKLFIVRTLRRQFEKDKEQLQTSSLPVASDVEEWLCKTLPGIPKQSVGKFWQLIILAFHGFNDHSTYVHYTHHFPGLNLAWKEPKIVFTEEDLSKCGIEVANQFDGYGLLNATHTHELSSDTVTYSFSHLTIQEFLCALFVTTISQRDQQNLLLEYFNAFPNVCVFFSGLTKLESSEQFKFVYNTLTKGIMNNPGFIAALKCIYEIQLSSTSCQLAFPFAFNLLGYSMVLPDECIFISHVLSHYPVKSLDVQMSQIGDKGAKFLAECYNNKSYTAQYLAALEVCACELTVDGLKHVLNIVEKNITSLRMLNVNKNQLGDEGIMLIAKTLEHSNVLTKLKIAALGEKFTVKGVRCVAEMLKGNKVLKVLEMGWNNIDDDGMSAISEALKSNSSLVELSLIMCKLSPTGATFMSEALMVNRALQVLDMQLNPLLDDGITAIASIFGISRLAHLYVDGCGITDIGANSIAEGLRVNQTITKLSMKGNGYIGKEGTRLILQSAVENNTCLQVELNDAYDEEVSKMLSILEKRKELHTNH